MRALLVSLVFLFAACSGQAQSGEAQSGEAQSGKTTPDATAPETAPSDAGAMTGEHLLELVRRVDADADVQPNGAVFSVAERDMALVFDGSADRMRLLTPVAPAGVLDEAILLRMAQANYDAVLDARYAVANGQVMAVFIHPLGSLAERDFVSGLAQTWTAAETFGTTYTSGAVVFGGGDSSGLLEELLRELEDLDLPDPI